MVKKTGTLFTMLNCHVYRDRKAITNYKFTETIKIDFFLKSH